MLRNLEEFGKFVEISGFRDVSVKDAKNFSRPINRSLGSGCEIQLFNAELVASWEHLYFAAINASVAFRNKCNLSKSLAVETVLYASAQRQIQKAIEIIGVKPETRDVAVLLICETMDLAKKGLEEAAEIFGKRPDETVLDLTEEKILKIRKLFDISSAEMKVVSARMASGQVLVDLIIERMALLSTRL